MASEHRPDDHSKDHAHDSYASDGSASRAVPSVRTLMAQLIDYAGLFPPSKLAMGQAATNFASYLESEHAWMLGRFVLQLKNLDEFATAANNLLPRTHADEPWRLSALLKGDDPSDLEPQIERIFAFNAAREENPKLGSAVIDSVEVRVPTTGADGARFIDRAMRIIPEQLEPYFEVPMKADPRGLIAAIAGTGGHAKGRFGGITPDLIPSSENVVRFITACAAGEVSFKATAGLHHPIRSDHPLTYEQGAPVGTMHGFINVFMAAALASSNASPQTIEAVINEQDPKAFAFTAASANWREKSIDVTRLARARETFAISYGSCSFTEPIEDLTALGLLPSADDED